MRAFWHGARGRAATDGYPSRRQATRGALGSASSELVIRREADFPALVWPYEGRTAEAHCSAEYASVAFRQGDLVGQIRSLHTELPVLADVREDAGTQHVIGPQRRPTRLILVALADMLV